MSKREALARAAAEVSELDWDRMPDGPKWGYSVQNAKSYWLDRVDAIIAELREPDDKMVRDGMSCMYAWETDAREACKETWQAMLDAIE